MYILQKRDVSPQDLKLPRTALLCGVQEWRAFQAEALNCSSFWKFTGTECEGSFDCFFEL